MCLYAFLLFLWEGSIELLIIYHTFYNPLILLTDTSLCYFSLLIITNLPFTILI